MPTWAFIQSPFLVVCSGFGGDGGLAAFAATILSIPPSPPEPQLSAWPFGLFWLPLRLVGQRLAHAGDDEVWLATWSRLAKML